MEGEQCAVGPVKAIWQDEIERAIDNVKRTRLDKWMRREWHKAGARDHWSEGRKAKWVEWKRHHSPGVCRGTGHQSERHRITRPKVWVKGHVPRDFLDWVERYWSHDDETRAMLTDCCFEVWER